MGNAQPKYHKTKPVPDPIRDKVETELNRLEQEEIIGKIDRTDWSAPIVVVSKANKTVRICGDIMVTTNPNVEYYPLRYVEDLCATLAGCKMFSKLHIIFCCTHVSRWSWMSSHNTM